MSNKKIIFGTLSLILFLTTSAFAQTWSSPTPSQVLPGNADAPLNVGGTGQSKIGGLILHNSTDIVTAPYGLLIPYGKVGIGTTTPTEALDVAGNAKAGEAHVDKVCNRAGLLCLNFTDINTVITGGGASGGPKINSYSISPSPAQYGDLLTYSGTAVKGSSCLTRSLLYVEGDYYKRLGLQIQNMGRICNSVSLPAFALNVYMRQIQYQYPDTLNQALGTYPWIYGPAGGGTYSVVWEVEDADGNVAKKTFSLNVLPNLPSGSFEITSLSVPPDSVEAGQSVLVTGTVTPGSSCLLDYQVYAGNNSPGVPTPINDCPRSFTLSQNVATSNNPNPGQQVITWTVRNANYSQTSATITVNTTPTIYPPDEPQ